MITIAEYNKDTNAPTGTLYTASKCSDVVTFNRNFQWDKFYAEVNGVKFYNMETFTKAVKEIIGE